MLALALTFGAVVLSVGGFTLGWVTYRQQVLKQSWLRNKLAREFQRGQLSAKPEPTLIPPKGGAGDSGANW